MYKYTYTYMYIHVCIYTSGPAELDAVVYGAKIHNNAPYTPHDLCEQYIYLYTYIYVYIYICIYIRPNRVGCNSVRRRNK